MQCTVFSLICFFPFIFTGGGGGRFSAFSDYQRSTTWPSINACSFFTIISCTFHISWTAASHISTWKNIASQKVEKNQQTGRYKTQQATRKSFPRKHLLELRWHLQQADIIKAPLIWGEDRTVTSWVIIWRAGADLK